MKNVFLIVGLTLLWAASNVIAQEGSCGDPSLSWISNNIIPDEWPMDEVIASEIGKRIGADNQFCRNLGVADLTEGCSVHDECYAYALDSRIGCDISLFGNWTDECLSTYNLQSPELFASGMDDIWIGGTSLIGNSGECLVEVGELIIDGTSYIYAKTTSGAVYFVRTTSQGVDYIKDKIDDLPGDALEFSTELGEDIWNLLEQFPGVAGSAISMGWNFVRNICPFCSPPQPGASDCADILGDIAQVGSGVVKIGEGIGNIPVDVVRAKCALQCTYAAGVMASITHIGAYFFDLYGSQAATEPQMSLAVKKIESTYYSAMKEKGDILDAEVAFSILDEELKKVKVGPLIPLYTLLLNN